jgi:ribulose-5-phosphate 4-epimerase/fuculose-1-phosphate aldolase
MVIDLGARISHPSLKGKVSEAEWETRCNQAALFRLMDHLGYNNAPNNHISARVPDEPDHFLINPGIRLYGEITASSLVKLDYDGNILQDDAPTGIVNAAAHVIHAATLEARPDVNCAVHLHTTAGVGVSILKQGLQNYCQEAFRFHGRTGYHEYEGIVRDTSERERLAHALGKNNRVVVLRNHGSLVVGRTIAEALQLTLHYETACTIQMAALQTGCELVMPPKEVAEKTANHTSSRNLPDGEPIWIAYKRLVDAYYPSYTT